MTPQQRRQWIIDRLRQGPVASQEELARWLARRGPEVTQATVSRDLRVIGVLKGRAGYYLPELSPTHEEDDEHELDGLLGRHAVRIDRADSLVVVRTAPGHASLLASALDRQPPETAVGTVAGDDTIFIATTGASAATRLTSRLRRRAGLPTRPRRD